MNPVGATEIDKSARRTGTAGTTEDIRRTATDVALPLVPGALTVYLSFNGGGFFAGTTAAVTVALALLLALRVVLAKRPFEGFGPAATVAAVGLGLYAVWTLVSAGWSDAPARALIEFDRALLYLLTLCLFASVARTQVRIRWLVWGVAAGIVVVCVAGFASRTLPELWSTADIYEERLGYPLTYSNSLGVLASIGLVLLLHIGARARASVAARIVGSAAIPLVAATLVLTFSRSAIAAGIIGLLVYAVVARPRGLLSVLLAAGPTSALAVITAYQAELIGGERALTPAAVSEGEEVALAVAGCVLACGLARAGLILLDRRLARLELRRQQVRTASSFVAIALLVAAVISIAADAPGIVAREYEQFTQRDAATPAGEQRERLTNPSNKERADYWRVAMNGFESHPVQGDGAGTYQLRWFKERPNTVTVNDAHSLYVEVLAELGLVGLAFLLLGVGSLLVGLAWRARGRDRRMHGALLAAGVAWALHAGIDWDWEVPATGVWFFAAGGLALALPPRSRRRISPPGRSTRVAIALGCLALAVTPALVFLSQAKLDQSVRAFKAGDCAGAIEDALSSSETLGVRPEPYVILGYCDTRLRAHRLAIEAMRNAVRRDPGDWELHYGLALVRAAAGLDPRAEARTAHRVNPREGRPVEVLRRFRTGGKRQWRRRALEAKLPRWLGESALAGE